MISVNLVINAHTHDMLRTIPPVAAHEMHLKKRQPVQVKDLSIIAGTSQDFHLLVFFRANLFVDLKPNSQISFWRILINEEYQVDVYVSGFCLNDHTPGFHLCA